MSWHTQIQSLRDIPEKEYEGYYWDGDSAQPIHANAIPVKFLTADGVPGKPFILEAFFYCQSENFSVSVRHLPGRYLIHRFDLSSLDPKLLTDKAMLAHPALGGKLRFKEVWQPVEDEQCENLEVLTRKALVFCGFDQEGN